MGLTPRNFALAEGVGGSVRRSGVEVACRGVVGAENRGDVGVGRDTVYRVIRAHAEAGDSAALADFTLSERQHIIDAMEFRDSARKHYAECGITDADVLHVIRNPLRLVHQDGDYKGRLLIIGADQSMRLLEVVVMPLDGPDRIIHANVLQPKNYEYL